MDRILFHKIIMAGVNGPELITPLSAWIGPIGTALVSPGSTRRKSIICMRTLKVSLTERLLHAQAVEASVRIFFECETTADLPFLSAATPDNLLLWFHHVNWTHVLHSGKSVMQTFYDAHYEGAETAQNFAKMMTTLQGKIDGERFDEMMFRQQYQAGHSIVWRDAIADYYWNMTGIPDQHDRVGNHPWRIAASSMQLSGYKPYVVNPFEAATPRDYTAVVTKTNTTTGTAMTKLDYPSGTYDLAVGFFDMYGGKTTWRMYLNDKMVGQWYGNAEDFLGHTPSIYIDGHSAIRKTFHDVEIERGDVLKIIGIPHGIEPAPLDYIAVLPHGIVD